MNVFQVDENLNSKEFVKGCRNERNCTLHRYPKSLMGEKDEQMLPVLLGQSATLVTSDFRIIADHRSNIIEPNSGVIIVRTDNSSSPFTLKRKMAIIRNFKERFPDWMSQDWRNIHLEIYDNHVYVTYLSSSAPENEQYFGLGDENFAQALKAYISELQIKRLSANNPSKSATPDVRVLRP